MGQQRIERPVVRCRMRTTVVAGRLLTNLRIKALRGRHALRLASGETREMSSKLSFTGTLLSLWVACSNLQVIVFNSTALVQTPNPITSSSSTPSSPPPSSPPPPPAPSDSPSTSSPPQTPSHPHYCPASDSHSPSHSRSPPSPTIPPHPTPASPSFPLSPPQAQ